MEVFKNLCDFDRDNSKSESRIPQERGIISKHQCQKYRHHLDQVAPMIANVNIPANHICKIFEECMEIQPLK